LFAVGCGQRCGAAVCHAAHDPAGQIAGLGVMGAGAAVILSSVAPECRGGAFGDA